MKVSRVNVGQQGRFIRVPDKEATAEFARVRAEFEAADPQPPQDLGFKYKSDQLLSIRKPCNPDLFEEVVIRLESAADRCLLSAKERPARQAKQWLNAEKKVDELLRAWNEAEQIYLQHGDPPFSTVARRLIPARGLEDADRKAARLEAAELARFTKTILEGMKGEARLRAQYHAHRSPGYKGKVPDYLAEYYDEVLDICKLAVGKVGYNTDVPSDTRTGPVVDFFSAAVGPLLGRSAPANNTVKGIIQRYMDRAESHRASAAGGAAHNDWIEAEYQKGFARSKRASGSGRKSRSAPSIRRIKSKK